ncbi:hypothetical protein [Chromobacterium violaceum]|uniref:hypothetical protein n=1 Tax=Chromobacterium violaceum TaxID=536 RepID=UPI001B3347CB|nr:hypothetical protein [Chromobacterium violaceum]MBP4045282.1 hypothetical protein [Chromobacterium violaceum]
MSGNSSATASPTSRTPLGNGELQRRGIAEQYQVAIGDLTQQPWRMLDFTLTDPSGVLWRIAQNL